MVTGSGQNGKDEEDCARTCGHGHAGGKGEREVQRPSKRRRASNWSHYPTWECATQVNNPDNPNYQLSAACRHTLDLIVGRLQSIYDLAG
jgi:hypothetical protein